MFCECVFCWMTMCVLVEVVKRINIVVERNTEAIQGFSIVQCSSEICSGNKNTPLQLCQI